MKALLVDDEKNALDVLEILIKESHPEIQIIGKINSGPEAIEKIKSLQPDVVFLDIEMPHKNGFDVISETQEVNYTVIFTTAYDQFAVKAFKVSAIDYLMKPIDSDDLQAAIKKLLQTQKGSDFGKIKGVMQELGHTPSQKIALPLGDAFKLYEPNEILRCESDSNYTHIIFTNGKKTTVAKTLKDIESSLQYFGFLRIHQSHLVNEMYIEGISRGDTGFVILHDKTKLPISRQKKELVLQKIKKV